MITTSSRLVSGATVVKSARSNCHGFTGINATTGGVTMVISDSNSSGTTSTVHACFLLKAKQTYNENFLPPLDMLSGLRVELLGGASGVTVYMRYS